MDLERFICNVADFPEVGICFKDLTPLLQNPEAFAAAMACFVDAYKDDAIDVVVAIESRGFLFAAPLALQLGCSLVLARKPGKLPRAHLVEEYALEYGTDSMEMHTDAIKPGQRVLIVDDVLATGGTASATAALVNRSDGVVVGHAFLIVLKALAGIKALAPVPVFTIIEA